MDYSKRYFQLLFFLYTTILLSQENKYIITGSVLNASNNTYVKDANIFIIDLKNNLVIRNTKSDSTGNFQISFDKGNYNLSVGHQNFEIHLIPINYAKFKNNTFNLGKIPLKPLDIKKLDEVVVTTKDFWSESKNNKRIYHIGNTLKDVAGSISNVLSYLPSISVDIDGTVQLRGKDPIVQINGRKSNLSKSEVLQMLPSDMIKRIEVVTRPSAKEAETAPIINIITDRKRKGLIGGVNFAFGVPSTTKGGLHLALNKETFNGYGLYGIKKENNIASSKKESIKTFNASSENLEVETNDNNKNSLNQFSEIQYEYLPNENSELVGNVSLFNKNNTLSTHGIRNTLSGDITQTTQINDAENNLFSIVTAHEYEHKFNSKREQLKVEVEYEFESRERSEEFSESSSTDNNFTTNAFDRLLSNEIELKSRYDWTIRNNGYLSIGYRFDLSTIDQEQFFLSTLNAASENNIAFTQFDNTLFGDYSNEFENIYFNIGFRLISTERNLSNQDSSESASKTFFNLLPQVNLEYEYGDNNEISLNYFNLLRQPRLSFLNSFNTSVDLQRIRIGNPDLKPQSTHTIELESFNEFEKSSLNTTLYTNFVRDIIQYASVFDAEGDVTISRPENIGRASTFGINLSYNMNSPKWLNSIIKLDGKYGTISDEDIKDNDFYRVNTSITNLIRLKSYKIELSWYYSPKNKVNFQTFQSSNQYFKFGVSKRVFKNKGNLVLSVLDPFNSGRVVQSINGSNFKYTNELRPNQRRFFLSLFVRFSSKSKFRNTHKNKREKGILE